MCNFTQAQSGTLILDGYNNAESVKHCKFYYGSKWATGKANLTATQGLCRYGGRRIKFLQDLVYCITDMKMYGKTVPLSKFYQKGHDISMDMTCIQNAEQEAREANERPAKFEVNKWI